jgi:hypothetical protein
MSMVMTGGAVGPETIQYSKMANEAALADGATAPPSVLK